MTDKSDMLALAARLEEGRAADIDIDDVFAPQLRGEEWNTIIGALRAAASGEPVAWIPRHPAKGWAASLAARDAQTASADLMRSVECAAQQGWSIDPVYA